MPKLTLERYERIFKKWIEINPDILEDIKQTAYYRGYHELIETIRTYGYQFNKQMFGEDKKTGPLQIPVIIVENIAMSIYKSCRISLKSKGL